MGEYLLSEVPPFPHLRGLSPSQRKGALPQLFLLGAEREGPNRGGGGASFTNIEVFGKGWVLFLKREAAESSPNPRPRVPHHVHLITLFPSSILWWVEATAWNPVWSWPWGVGPGGS